MKPIITIIGTLAFACSLSFAQDKPAAPAETGKQRPSAEESFKKLDKDSDGKVTLDEFKAGPRAQKDPAKAEEYFKKMDKDGDSNLTLEEYKAGRMQRGPGKGGKRGDTPPPAPEEK